MNSREIAAAVIADKLGIPRDQVTDDTALGDAWSDITVTVCFRTSTVVIGNTGMTAGDVFKQLR